MALLAVFYIVIILMIFQVKPGYYELEHDLYQLKSCWTFVRSFFEIFGIQVYFLWILQSQKRSVLIHKRNQIIMIPTTGIFIASMIFVVISYMSINCNVDYSQGIFSDPEAVYQTFMRNPLGLSQNLLRVAIQFCSFPFQFYIGKDFFFILYDELKNKSISKKIDELKRHTTTRGVYTKDMLRKVDTETFEFIR